MKLYDALLASIALLIFVSVESSTIRAEVIHPDLANSFDNIGIVLNSQGEYEQAFEYYQQALEMNKKIL